MNFFIVAYDIPNDKRRNKTADILQDYGQRVQFSVFEVWLNDAHKKEMLKRLKKVLNLDEDAVRLYAMCASCRERTEVLGIGSAVVHPTAIIL